MKKRKNHQPGTADGGTQADTIGTLDRFVPVNVSGGDNEVDCALAIVPEPPKRHILVSVHGHLAGVSGSG